MIRHSDNAQLRFSPQLSVVRATQRVSHPQPERASLPRLDLLTLQTLTLGVSKLVTTIVSTFTAHYIYHWGTYFPSTPLHPPYLPSFDGRAVLYPTTRILRDYMSWRQVDCAFDL